VCDENLIAGMKMFRETLTFRETSRKICGEGQTKAQICLLIPFAEQTAP
jgi:hypothetical protein